MLANGDGVRRALGGEAFLRYVAGPLQVIGSYTYLDVTEAEMPTAGGAQWTVCRATTAELAALLEDEDRGRIGIEVSYTGRQNLVDNSYRTSSPSYVELNALAEMQLGETAVFLNAINLTDVRQATSTRCCARARSGGKRITDLWAPVAGRVFNLGVRLEF